MKRVFLGGTCNGSDWRERLIPMLSNIDYFNPVVENWTITCQEEERRQRKICDFCLYCITPKMTGVYSIAEVVDDSNKRPDQTLIAVLDTDRQYHTSLLNFIVPEYCQQVLSFTDSQRKSLKAVQDLIVMNGGRSFNNLKDVANFLNNF